MTSLDPSHIPGLNYTQDRTTGQAVYDSVSATLPNGQTSPSRLFPTDDPTAPSRPHRRRDRTRSHSDADSDSGPERIPVPPIPDLRYEQGVLASLKPFLHRVPEPDAPSTSSNAGHETEKHEREVQTAEKVTLAARNLTAEGTPPTQSDRPSDIFLGPLRVEWSRVAYVIVRDQILSPLIQGVLWGVAGYYLSAIWSWNKARIAAQRSGVPSSRPSLLASLGIRTW